MTVSFFVTSPWPLDDHRLMVIPNAGEQISGDVQLVGRADERLVRVREQALDGRREERMVTDLDPAVEHAAHGGAGRRDRSPAVEELVPEIREPFSDSLRLPGVEAVLQLLDLRVHRVQRLEMRLRDLVDETVDEVARGRLLVGGRIERRNVERVSTVARRLPHRDDDGGRGNEVDLQVAHPILGRKRARRDENAEDIRTVALEQGARLATVLGGRYERLDDVRVDLDRQRGEELLAGRVDEVEPACAHSPRA